MRSWYHFPIRACFTDPWIFATIGLVAVGGFLWTLPLMGRIGRELSKGDWWAKAHLAFFYGSALFAVAFACNR